jgi:hypothetical protein
VVHKLERTQARRRHSNLFPHHLTTSHLRLAIDVPEVSEMSDLLDDIQSFLDGMNEGGAGSNSHNNAPERRSAMAGLLNNDANRNNTWAPELDEFGTSPFPVFFFPAGPRNLTMAQIEHS